MKLISLLAVLPSAFGTEVSSIADLFQYFVGSTGLGLHGCHCRGIAGNGGFKGQPLDELDTLCKQWSDAMHCLFLEGGPCHGIEDVVYDLGDLCRNQNDGSTRGICTEQLCRMNEVHAMDLVNLHYELRPVTIIDVGDNAQGICGIQAPTSGARPAASGDNGDSANTNNGGGSVNERKCCGSDGYFHIYHTSESVCDDNEITPRGPGITEDDCTAEETWDEPSQTCSTTLTEFLDGGNSYEHNLLGYIVHVSDDSMTWDAAQTYCHGLGQGFEMAMPANVTENEVFFENLTDAGANGGWWGFKRFDASDLETWNGADMRPMNWDGWCTSEPNNWAGNERCALAWGRACWSDMNCANLYRAICAYYG